MADYYTQFSFMVPVAPEQAEAVDAWLKETLGEGEDGSYPGWEKLSAEGDGFPPCFEAEFIPKESGIWIHSDDGDPNQAAILVYAYLGAFNVKDRIGFEYAMTCSKPRLDGFGGGAVVVSAEGVEHFGTATWLDQWLKGTDTRFEQSLSESLNQGDGAYRP